MVGANLGAYNIEDLRQMAKKRLPRGIFEYVDRGAEDEIALRYNREVYQSLKIKNRVLVDVSKRSTETEIFGRKIAMPYGISPTASAGLMSERGEVGLAKAAANMGIPCTVATNSLTSMEEILAAAGGNLWFQLYMWVDVDLRMAFVKRIKAVGFETLLVTVDGSGRRNVRRLDTSDAEAPSPQPIRRRSGPAAGHGMIPFSLQGGSMLQQRRRKMRRLRQLVIYPYYQSSANELSAGAFAGAKG